MRDLREVGNRVIKAIMNRKPADAGDLALGIEQLILDMRLKPDQVKEKLDHLEGLFKELAYGEEYELREKRVEPETQTINPYGIMSGVMSFPQVSGYIPPSGWNNVAMPPIVTTGVIPNAQQQLGNQQPNPTQYSAQNPCGEESK